MRTWSLRLARIAGIDVYVHATFFNVVAWIGLLYWRESGTVAGGRQALVWRVFVRAVTGRGTRGGKSRYHRKTQLTGRHPG